MFPQQKAWKDRLAAKVAADAKEAERQEELERLWTGPAEENWQRIKEQHGGPQLSEEELKERQARYVAEAPARQEAQRARDAFRRQLSEQLVEADRHVEQLAIKAQRDLLDDDELELYVAAHARAAALRSLINSIGRADDRSARATPFTAGDPRAFARV